MRLIAGVDSDPSSTVAAIADETGRVLGRATVPATHLAGETQDSSRRQAVILHSLDAARSAADIFEASPLDALVIGLTEYDEEVVRLFALDGIAERLAVMQHAEIAHAGAPGGKHGIVVLAGASSVALGTAPGLLEYVRVGGWGHLFGDEGSAFWIGREGIRSAMLATDRGEPSRLSDAALTFFNVPTLHALQHAYARGNIAELEIAAFARVTLDLASELPGRPGVMDREAYFVRTHTAHLLTELAMTVEARLPASSERRFSYAGKIFEDEGLRSKFACMLEMRRSAAQQRAYAEDFEEVSEPDRIKSMRSPPRAPHLIPLPPLGDSLDRAITLGRRLAAESPSETTWSGADILALAR